MARAQLNYLVTTSIGTTIQIANAATVTVTNTANNSLATLYSSQFGGATITNPLTADGSGRVSAWVEIGKYLLTILGPGLSPYTEYWESVPGEQIVNSGKGYVTHDADPNVARPTGFASVEWVGSVTPANALPADTWVNTAANSFNSRMDAVEAEVSIDTSDATVRDAVAINVPTTKKRRVPIADKKEYDLREFYSGDAQPADMLGYIHDGLEKTRVGGGSLLVSDSIEPWEVSGPIIPPMNSRMHGPQGGGRFSERYSKSGHTGNFYALPVLPNAIGEAWIKLKNGSNCPILMNDFDNSHGKRGPDRGNGAYWQWFAAERIRFDHNGTNQTMSSLGAIYFQDAWGMELIQCGLVAPRYRGLVLSNCNSCNSEKFSVAGDQEGIADGTGVANGTTTVTGATGTWAIGDFIFANSGGVTIPSGTTLINVTGSVGNLTLTLSAAATGSGTTTLNHTVYISDHHIVLEDSTVDTEMYGVSAHAARVSTLLLDSAYGCRISGLFGYTIGGHNVWLRNTMTGSSHYVGGCKANYVAGRCDQATKHNVRIDNGCTDNVIDVIGFGCGINNTSNDADAGWATVYCDGQSNVIRGTGSKATSPLSNMSAVVAYGPNAVDNLGMMGGASDLPTTFPLYRYRAVLDSAPGAIYSNTNPAPPIFMLQARDFTRVDGTAARAIIKAVTCVAATNLFTATAHGLVAGDQVELLDKVGGAGITVSSPYFVIATGLTANDFKVSTTIGGTELDVTTDMTAGWVRKPELDYFNGTLHRAMRFDDGLTESAIAYCSMPVGCRRALLRAEMVNLNPAVSGNVRVQIGYADVAQAGTTLSTDEQIAGPVTQAITANQQNWATTGAGAQIDVGGNGQGTLVAIRFKRFGADAADTLAGPLGLIGVEVEPLLVG